MPDAFISMTTSWASGAGSGNCINSSPRSPVNTIPRIAASVCLCLWFDLERKNVIGKGRTDRELQAVAPAPRKIGAGGYGSRLARSLSSGRPKAGPVGLAGTTPEIWLSGMMGRRAQVPPRRVTAAKNSPQSVFEINALLERKALDSECNTDLPSFYFVRG